MLKPALEVRLRERLLITVFVTGQTTTIGRSTTNDIVLDNASVSRKHAEIVDERGEFVVMDLNSANGVRLNGDLVKGQAPFLVGDELRIGKYMIKLVLRDTARRDLVPPALQGGGDDTTGTTLDLGDPEVALAKMHQEPEGDDSGLFRDLVHGLQVYKEDEVRFEKLVDEPVVNIGRSSSNDLMLRGEDVSRHHARIRRSGEDFEIEDLDSGNGTFLNGRRITRGDLAIGDEIRIGSYRLFFLWVDPGEGAVVAEVGMVDAAPDPETGIQTVLWGDVKSLREKVDKGED